MEPMQTNDSLTTMTGGHTPLQCGQIGGRRAFTEATDLSPHFRHAGPYDCCDNNSDSLRVSQSKYCLGQEWNGMVNAPEASETVSDLTPVRVSLAVTLTWPIPAPWAS